MVDENNDTETPAASHASASLAIKAASVGKVIEERPILRGINLEIARGEFVALLGANGAGKSTLLKMIAGLGSPSSGKLDLFPADTASQHASGSRGKLGLIGHQTMLYHDLSAIENLEFFGKLYGVPNARQRGMELLERLGLKPRAHDAVKGFSRGMAQRVAIARALMHDPDLLLADEPFAGLDAPSTAMVEKVLRELQAAGKTIILANHDIRQSLRLAEENGGRIVMLARGEKVVDCPAGEVTVDELLARMEGAPQPPKPNITKKPTASAPKKPAPPSHSGSLLRQMAALVGKDLRIEGRTRQTMGLVVVLGILIVAVLGLGLGSLRGDDARKTASMLTPAILWVAYLFAGVLCFEKTMAVERQDGALAGLLISPLDRSAIYGAKLLSNLVLMFGAATVITPVGVLFFQFDLSPGFWAFIAIMAISMVGFAAIGTLFAALVSSTKLQGGMLSMVIFPLILPLVIASTTQVTSIFGDGVPPSGLVGGLPILIAFDVIFLVVSWIVFELVIEP